MNVHCIILAGGDGERLWPFSRKRHPKQLLSIENEKKILVQTIERALLITIPEYIWVVCTQQQLDLFKKNIPDIPINFITEPSRCNTGPALLYACFTLYKQHGNVELLVFPADAYIPSIDYNSFTKTIIAALDHAQAQHALVLCGARPTYPATSYGYIRHESIDENDLVAKIIQFHEKPTHAKAVEYIEKNMAWNTGIIAAELAVLLEEYKICCPVLYNQVQGYVNKTMSYEHISPISVDCAVMERSSNLLLMMLECRWFDIGTLSMFLQLQQESTGYKQEMISIAAKANITYVPNALVVLIGVEEMCIAFVDGILIIVHRNFVDQVRLAIDEIKMHKSLEHYL